MIPRKLAWSIALACAWNTGSAQLLGRNVDEQACLREVRQYLEAMKFIRESAGKGIGDKVAMGLWNKPNCVG